MSVVNTYVRNMYVRFTDWQRINAKQRQINELARQGYDMSDAQAQLDYAKAVANARDIDAWLNSP